MSLFLTVVLKEGADWYFGSQELIQRLSERTGQVIDFHTWDGYFVYDMMSDLAFGGKFISRKPLLKIKLMEKTLSMKVALTYFKRVQTL